MKSCFNKNVNLFLSANRVKSLQSLRVWRALSSIKKFESIPGPKPSLPLIGTGWQYLRYIGRYELSKLHEANEDKYRRYGPILVEHHSGTPIVHVFDPTDFETVFRNQGKCPFRPPNEFVRHYRLSRSDKYPNVGLAHMVGEEWYKHRLLLAPVLMSLKALETHISAQSHICDDFISYLWANRDESSDILIDLQDATYRLALESICMMCLDSRMRCLSTTNATTTDGNLLISATKRLFESYNQLYYGIPVWKLFATNSYRKLDESESAIYSIASKYVQIEFNKLRASNEHVRQRDQSLETEHNSVLQTLIKTDGLSESDIKITIIDFIAGGIFTVSNTLSFLFYHLAKNVDVQEKLYQEINSVMGNESDVSTAMLAKLPYLKACVKECFRLSSTVPGIMRILPTDVVLSGYHIPAGTIIFSQFMVSCRLSQYFDDPLAYRPERWLGESRKRCPSFAVLPFGHGNRMCAGRRFSELELYVATAKLVQRYRLEAVNDELSLRHSFIVIPAHPISLRLTLRESLMR